MCPCVTKKLNTKKKQKYSAEGVYVSLYDKVCESSRPGILFSKVLWFSPPHLFCVCLPLWQSVSDFCVCESSRPVSILKSTELLLIVKKYCFKVWRRILVCVEVDTKVLSCRSLKSAFVGEGLGHSLYFQNFKISSFAQKCFRWWGTRAQAVVKFLKKIQNFIVRSNVLLLVRD